MARTATARNRHADGRRSAPEPPLPPDPAETAAAVAEQVAEQVVADRLAAAGVEQPLGAPPFTDLPETPEEQLEEQREFEALNKWQQLARESGGDDGGGIYLTVFKISPLPSDARGEPYDLGVIRSVIDLDNLRDHVIPLAQQAGEFGRGVFRVYAHSSKKQAWGGHAFVSPRSVQRHLFVPPVPGVLPGGMPATAAAAVGLGVKDVFEVADRIKAQTPAAPSALDELVKLRQAGMLPEGVDIKAWIPLATVLLSGLKEVFQRPPDPVTTALLTKLATPDPLVTALLTKLADRALEPAKSTGLGDRLVGRVLDYALESGGVGGERSLLGEVKDLLVGVAETEAGRNFGAGARDVGAAVLERVRGGGAVPRGPAAPVTAAATPLPSGAMHQVQTELAAAAQRRDQSYFPVFVSRVRELFPTGGAAVLEAIAGGTMDDAQAFVQLEAVGFQLTPPVQSYLRWLMGWLRWQYKQTAARPAVPMPPAAAPPTSGPNGTTVVAPGVGRCMQCGTEYEGEPASFAEPCDKCGGQIIAVEGPR